MTIISRAEWGARPPEPGPGPLDPTEVVGVALHWPAMARPLTSVPEVSNALRGWQNYHMDVKGWSDIAYQEAVDQAGNVYTLRGLRTQSGANGDTDVNQAYGALLLVLAPGELPTPAMMAATRRRIARHRELFTRSTRIVGHNMIRPEPTACPGPIVTNLVSAGRFEPNAHDGEEDEMTPEDMDKLADLVAKRVWAKLLAGMPDAPDGRHAGATLAGIHRMVSDLHDG